MGFGLEILVARRWWFPGKGYLIVRWARVVGGFGRPDAQPRILKLTALCFIHYNGYDYA